METLENPNHSRDNGPVVTGQDWADGRQAAWLLGLRAHHAQEADQTPEFSLRDGGGGAMAGADRLNRIPLPQDQQERLYAPLSVGQHAADLPVAAVLIPQRPGDGSDPDRGAHHPQLCWHRADQRPDPG